MIRKYPAIFLLLFVVGGVVTADLSHWSSWIFLLTALAAGLGGLLLFNRNTTTGTMLLLGCSFGSVVAVHFALSSYDFGNRHLARIVDEDRVCHIFGRVSDWPDLKTYATEITVTVDSLGGDICKPVEGAVLVKITDTTTALQMGDRIEFHGRIYPIRTEDRGGSFNYGRYLRMRGISGMVYLPTLLDVRIDRRYQYGFLALTDRIRSWITDCFRRNFSPDHAALASGFLIGETRDIPAQVYRQFRESGTLHLLAVSGSNVALVLLVCIVLLRPFGLNRRQRGLVLIVLLLLFAVISYGQPSVIRAAVMAGLVIIAGMLERRYDLNNLIALSAVLILAVDPGELFDVGFQLSYATAWGLIFIVPRVTRLFENSLNKSWYRWLIFPLIVSLVAQIVSAPLIMLYFGQAPLLSLPANLLIVPLTGVAVVGVMVLVIANLIWPMLGLLVGSVVSLVLEAVLHTVELFGSPSLPSLQMPSFTQSNSAISLVLFVYLLIVLGVVAISNKMARRALVWTAVAGCMTGLAFGLMPNYTEGEAVRLTTIPGGVAAVRMTEGSPSADLIILGCSAREYSVSERILFPWLTRLGVDSIEKCFVFGAEYKALGDMLSLQDSVPVAEYHFPQIMRQSVNDVLTHSGRTVEDDKIKNLSGSRATDLDILGYHATSNTLVLTVPGGAIWFAVSLADIGAQLPNGIAGTYIVLGDKVSDLRQGDSLGEAGVRGIICADFEQRQDIRGSSSSQFPFTGRPNFWFSVRVRGEVELHLMDSIRLGR